MNTTRTRRFALAAPLVALSLAFGAPVANAGPLLLEGSECASSPVSQPFLPWGDVGRYELAPRGSFENGTARWSLDSAAVAAGNETYYVGDEKDKRSLSINDGGSATSPVICVSVEKPTVRFFAKSSTGSLRVEVLYEDLTGAVRTATIGGTAPADNWEPSLPLPIAVNLTSLLTGGTTPVKIRFTAEGGAVSVDDFYVDPMRRS